MKKTLSFCIISILAVSVSCKQEEMPQLPESKAEHIHTGFRAALPGSSSKTALDMSTGLITWITDDPIYMTNGGSSMPLYVEEGGSTEAALYALEKVFEGNSFYAVYPLENADYSSGVFTSVIPSTQKYVKGGFATQTFPMVAICDKERRFAFRNAASLLRIETQTSLTEGVNISYVTVSSDNPMSGPISVNYALGQEPIVDCAGGENFVTIVGPDEGIPFGEAINVVVAPGDYSNVRIRLTLTNGLTSTYNLDETISVNRSAYRSISVNVADNFQDLSSTESANCYMITQPGSYKFKANIKGNGVETSCHLPAETGGISNVILYHSDGNTFIDGNFALVGDYIYFSTVDGVIPTGTALVSAVDEDGRTLWSWHIWANSDIEDVTLSDGSIWLNMNLGAHQIGFNPAGYNGYYYQWGRKDPFLQKYTESTSTSVLAPFVSHASKTDGSLENSIANPHIFYGGYHTSSETDIIEDWSSYDDEVKVYDWWNANIDGDGQNNREPRKTMFDPCPAGYHVPVFYELNALLTLTKESSSIGDNGRLVEGKLFFPYSSYRYIAIYAKWWPGGSEPSRIFIPSSTPYQTTTRHHRRFSRMYMTSSPSQGILNGVRSYAVPVRCIKDGSVAPVDEKSTFDGSIEDMIQDDWD